MSSALRFKVPPTHGSLLLIRGGNILQSVVPVPDLKLMEKDGYRYRLTDRGMDISNLIMSEFLLSDENTEVKSRNY